MNWHVASTVLLTSALVSLAWCQELAPTVEIEEPIYSWVDSQNGSFPQWTYGSTVLVRVGEDLLLSATETIPDQIPLENCRWVLMQRTDEGWVEVNRERKERTREPSPLCAFADGRVFMSVNPTLGTPDQSSAPAHPQILQFSSADPGADPQVLEPVFVEDAQFSNHSYRGFGCDPGRGELLLVNVEAYRGQHWSFCDAAGEWSSHGIVDFPSYDSFKGPLPMRYLYPQVAMRNGAAHVFTKGGLEDIDEARHKYREEHKIGIWLRPSLGYCWSPDIATQPLSEWIPAVDVIEQAGETWNCDLYVDAAGDAHLLWWEASIDARLRPAFFADVPYTKALKHGIMREGRMVFSETLVEGGEGLQPETPVWGCFHVAPGDRLFVYYSLSGPGGSDHPGTTNWLTELKPGGGHSEPVQVPLQHPLGMLFMSTRPGGSPPSNVLELAGRPVDVPLTINYARVRLFD
ncbi:MAG TPA: hypothetical protein VM283_08490 [Armatimonadota bacterium]|nr:hypothetical protein [Armatimonadota bacterium]